MNVLASECTSGCESGWTLYLEHSHDHSPNGSHRNNTTFVDGNDVFCDEYKGKCVKEDYEEEEEDLSMVSDASSGPPHFNEDEVYFNDDNGCQYSASKATAKKSGKKQQKSKEHRHRKDQNLPPFLDDTASSPVFNFSSKVANNFTLTNNQASMESVLDYSQGFSATQFQGRATYQDHYGFLQSSVSGNQFQDNQWL